MSGGQTTRVAVSGLDGLDEARVRLSTCRGTRPTPPSAAPHPDRPGGPGRSNPPAGVGAAPGPRSTPPTRAVRSPWVDPVSGHGHPATVPGPPLGWGHHLRSTGCGPAQAVACGRAAPPGALVQHRRCGPRRLPQLEPATGGGATGPWADPPVGRRASRPHRIDPPRRAGPRGRRVHRRRVRHRHRRGPRREPGRPLRRASLRRWSRRADGHTATVLPDGRVVLVGGFAGEGVGALGSVEVLAPDGGAASQLGELAHPTGRPRRRAAPGRAGAGGRRLGGAPAPPRPPRRSSIPTPARSRPDPTSPSPVMRWTPSRSPTGGSSSPAGRSLPGAPPPRPPCSIRARRRGARSARWAPLGSSTSGGAPGRSGARARRLAG